MKRVMITVALVMMVSILFGVSAYAAHTSKNVTHRMGKRSSLKSAHSGSKRKQLKKNKKIKKPKAAGSVKIEMEGKVIEQLPNALFRVKLQNGSIVTAHIAGKLRMNFIRIRFGDRVLVDMSPDQPDRGRIIWRYKQ